MNILEKIDNRLNEASEIKFEELEDGQQKAFKTFGINTKEAHFFHGIHGDIVDVDRLRILTKDLKKFKNARWVDIVAIGF